MSKMVAQTDLVRPLVVFAAIPLREARGRLGSFGQQQCVTVVSSPGANLAWVRLAELLYAAATAAVCPKQTTRGDDRQIYVHAMFLPVRMQKVNQTSKTDV
jgi:hypothetical protein